MSAVPFKANAARRHAHRLPPGRSRLALLAVALTVLRSRALSMTFLTPRARLRARPPMIASACSYAPRPFARRLSMRQASGLLHAVPRQLAGPASGGAEERRPLRLRDAGCRNVRVQVLF